MCPTSDRLNRYQPRRARRLSLRVGVRTLVAAVAVAVVTAACGTSSPGVASGGPTTPTTSAASSQARLDEYGSCMRKHGNSQFPNPIQNGNSITMMKMNTPQYASADATCRHFLPDGVGVQGATITAADQVDYLKAVGCMHTHGFTGIPDPTFTGDNVHIAVPSTIDQSSSQFEKALATCRKLIPAGLPYSS